MKYVWPTQWPLWWWHFQTHGSMNVYTVWKKLISGCGLEWSGGKKKILFNRDKNQSVQNSREKTATGKLLISDTVWASVRMSTLFNYSSVQSLSLIGRVNINWSTVTGPVMYSLQAFVLYISGTLDKDNTSYSSVKHNVFYRDTRGWELCKPEEWTIHLFCEDYLF